MNSIRIPAVFFAGAVSVATAAFGAPPKDQLVLWLRADSGLATDGST